MKLNSKYIACAGLLGLILFNIYLHWRELTILVDVNDNIFQFALIDEAQNILSHIFSGKLSLFYLFDSFNERWNEGFSLSMYYSHLPQAVFALISFLSGISSYQIFNVSKFVFLVLLPLPFFAAMRKAQFTYLQALAVAAVSHFVITDGLYGIDSSSYLWRGWGLSSQLFAVFFIPLALVYTYNFITRGKDFYKSLLFNILVAQNHSGIFLMALLAYPLVLLFHLPDIKKPLERLVATGFSLLFLLAYFFIPFFIYSDFRNFSYWDPLWKFNSFGVMPVITWFLNGNLFDFGRIPIVTSAVIFGLFYGLQTTNKFIRYIGVLFMFYFVLFFGRSGLGSFINLIPGFSEFHQHRVLVMVHIIGVILAGYFVGTIPSIISRLLHVADSVAPSLLQAHHLPKKSITLTGAGLLIGGLLLLFYLEKPIVKYAHDNANMISPANTRYLADHAAYERIKNKLKSLPHSRVYAGRPGNWGRAFKVGDAPLYMTLSRDGFAGVGFAPESWSPTTELDQFFNDQDLLWYQLFGIRYALFPGGITPPKFAKEIAREGRYTLYEIQIPDPLDQGWFTFGTSSTYVYGNKTWFTNLIHQWIATNAPKNREYPQIGYNIDPRYQTKNQVKMTSLNTFIDKEGKEQSLWEQIPLYDGHNKKGANVKKLNEEVLPQTYQATFQLTKACPYCVVILKQTYHPGWEVKSNGQVIQTFPVFPYYLAFPMEKTGTYQVKAVYKPNGLKTFFILIELMVVGGWIAVKLFRKYKH